MTKAEAIELVGDSSRCPHCRWLAAGYILRGYWDVDVLTIAMAYHIRWYRVPKEHR